MKIRVNTAELRVAVNTVIPALAVKSEAVYTKVYEFIYISAEESSIILKCCNLNMQIETEIPAFTESDGDVLLPGKTFSELVAKLPGEETLIELTDDTVKIVSGTMSMKLQTIPAAEFEGIMPSQSDIEVRIEEGTLKRMILQTSPFALQDNTRPVLRGVLVEVNDDELNMVAMDPLKFAMRTEKTENATGKNTSIIILSKLFESAARVLSDTNEMMTLIFSRQSLTLVTKNTTIILLRLDGSYIEYKALIPKSYDTRVTLSRKDFISLIDRAYVIAKEDTKNVVKLTYENDLLTVTVENELGSSTETMNVYIAGSGLTICFNIKCFMDVVKSIDADDFVFDMTQPNRPCVIKPVEGNSFCYLVLPIMIR